MDYIESFKWAYSEISYGHRSEKNPGYGILDNKKGALFCYRINSKRTFISIIWKFTISYSQINNKIKLPDQNTFFQDGNGTEQFGASLT